MLDFLASIEGVTTIVAFVSASWGVYQKFQTSKARKEALEISREGKKQREKIIYDNHMSRQRLLDEIQELGERHDRDLALTQEQFEKIITGGKEEMASLRGQIGKLMDMIMSGEEINVEPNGETISIKGPSGEVTMRTATLNKVVEVTAACRYEKSGGMFNKSLKRVMIEPEPLQSAYSPDPLDRE